MRRGVDRQARLPVAVIGAGPVGLAAAAHLAARGERFVVLETGASVGAHVAAWGHVQVFSPWRYNVDPVARGLLASAGWPEPDGEALPTGAEILAQYLEPLAKLPAIAPHLRLGVCVVAVTRAGFDKMKTAGRAAAAFELRVRSAAGEEIVAARAVIDASGTYGVPNPLGASGLAASGETACRDRIAYGIPDVLGDERARYAGRAVLVVGSGHSSFNALLDLAALATAAPGTRLTWAVRRSDVGALYGGGVADALPARGGLGERLRALVEDGHVELVTGVRVAAVRRAGARIAVVGGDGRVLGPFDEIIGATGFRPDLAMLAELRLDLDPVVESPRARDPDRSQRPWLWHRPAPRRRGAAPSRARSVRRGHEELRPRAHVPDADGLRAGAIRRRRAERRRRGRTPRRAHPPTHRRVLRDTRRRRDGRGVLRRNARHVVRAGHAVRARADPAAGARPSTPAVPLMGAVTPQAPRTGSAGGMRCSAPVR